MKTKERVWILSSLGGVLLSIYWWFVETPGLSWAKDLFLVALGIVALNCILYAMELSSANSISKKNRGDEGES